MFHLLALGNRLLNLLFGRKTITQQNISDCLRVAIAGYVTGKIDRSKLNQDTVKEELRTLFECGEDYFKGKGRNDWIRLQVLKFFNGDTSVKLTKEEKKS